MKKRWAVSVKLTEASDWSRIGTGSTNLHLQVNTAAELLEMHAKLGSEIAVRIIKVENDNATD